MNAAVKQVQTGVFYFSSCDGQAANAKGNTDSMWDEPKTFKAVYYGIDYLEDCYAEPDRGGAPLQGVD